MRYNVYTYDVWGNETDGFEVNDKFYFGFVDINPDDTDETLVSALKDIGLVKDTITASDIDTSDSDDDIIYINDASNGKPFCELLKA